MIGSGGPVPLDSPEGQAALDRLALVPALLAFDFDGTLAPIVTDPAAARAEAHVIEAARRLCEVAAVAVITGRSIADARSRLAFSPRYVVGNHGMEGLPGTPPPGWALREICRRWLAQLSGASLPAGVMIEDKGVSLSVHWRGALPAAPRGPAPASVVAAESAVIAAVEAAVGRLEPQPKRIPGKAVLNLLPPGARDKRSALQALVALERASLALFVGDDVTDEVVFEAAPAEWITVRIGPFDRTAARYCLPDQARIGWLLDALLERLE